MTIDQSIGSVNSDQSAPHTDLEQVVRRHLMTTWRKPTPAHTQKALDEALEWLAERDRPLLLDSYCGTGMSTQLLAERHPDCAVIGVDKSAARLSRHSGKGSYLLLRAECEPFWRGLVESGVSTRHHYLLYPNPWPKSKQLKRRIHGHPGLPWLLRLGGTLELRSNWSIFIREFSMAMAMAGVEGTLAPLHVLTPLTLFERKYGQRNEKLWRWRGGINAATLGVYDSPMMQGDVTGKSS